MSDNDNPYSSMSGSYTTAMHYGKEGNGSVASLMPAANGPTSGPPKDTTTKDFAADVIEESRVQPVLVDFWAPWCGPCKQLAPALEKMVDQAGGRVKLVKMNIDDHPSIAGQLGIQSIPAVIAFRDGKPVDAFMGAVPESEIRDFIDRVAGPDLQQQMMDALAAASEAMQSGDLVTADEIYAAVLAQDAENAEALGGRAEILFEQGELEKARAMLSDIPAAMADKPAIAAVKAKLTLAEQTSELGDIGELEQRLSVDPADHQARFDLALALNARDQRQEATDQLLAIMKSDRTWKEDGAREQLLQFFEAWGFADDATQAGRRKLSSLLFS